MVSAQLTRSMLNSGQILPTAESIAARAGGALLLVAVLLGSTQTTLGQESTVQALIERGQQAGVDATQMQTVAKRAREAGMDPNETAALLRPAVELSEKDLPAGPLLTKSLEGLAKNVPPSRMRPVLGQLRTHTERAGEIVLQWTQQSATKKLLGMSGPDADRGPPKESRTEMVTAITRAQQQDIPEETITSFLDNLPSAVERRPVSMGAVATAVSVLPDLPGSKSSSDAATKLLTAALDAGYTQESLQQLPAALQSAGQARQEPPGALVANAAQAIAQGTPAASVLQGLFQGSLPGLGPPAGRGGGPPGTVPGNGKPPGKGGKPPGKGPPGNPPGGGPPGNTGGNGSG